MLKMKTTTLRYWLKKNILDCKENGCTFDLNNLTSKTKVSKTIQTQRTIKRYYEQIMIENPNIFKKIFENYMEFVKKIKSINKMCKNLNWTTSAIDCYLAGLNCSKCFNERICSKFTKEGQTPPMKKTVLLLIKNRGIPVFTSPFEEEESIRLL